MTAILVMAWAPTAHAGQVTGNDVSYPQCGQALPSGQAFDIVAVNEGLPNNTNPCLADEISWAQLAPGTSRQPRISLYVNTADPGNHGITGWPGNNIEPLFGNHIKDPYGACQGGNGPACAWQYGWNVAELAPLTAGGTVTLTQWKTKPANSDFSCG